MKHVKDRMDNLLPTAEMNQLLDIYKSAGATHVEIATVIGHPNFVAHSQIWAAGIHARNMFATWRCAHWNMEGLYGQPKFVGGNRQTQQFWINAAVNAFTLIASSIQIGDEEAIYPERTEGIFNDNTSFLDPVGLPGTYATFFINLHEALKIFPWIVGKSANNGSELLSGWIPGSLINYAGEVVTDHYRDGDPALYEAEIRQMAANYGKPVYVQEGAPNRFATPTRAQSDAYNLVNEEMEDDGVLTGFGSWSGWSGTPESIVNKIAGIYSLNENGLSLQAWWGSFVPPPDTTPPIISNVQSNPTSNASVITWSTNESATRQVEYGTTVAYGSLTTENTTLLTSHSQTLSGLTPSTLYHYRVKSKDAAGNLTTSADFTFTTPAVIPPPDTTPPVISNVQSDPSDPNTAIITWNTNESATRQVEYGTTTGYGSQTAENTTLLTSHSQTLSGLTANTLYHFRVKSKDAAGNISTSADFTFTTPAVVPPPDTTPPVISNIQSDPSTPTTAVISWSTNENSTRQVEYGTTTAYGLQTTENTTLMTTHSQTLSGLVPNTLYHFRVKSKDASGNLTVSEDSTFTTPAVVPPPDTTPPVISGVQSNPTDPNTAIIIWETNENATRQIDYGTTVSYGSQTAENTTLMTLHSQTLSGLIANTLYHYRVRSQDAAGNLTISNDFTFTTPAVVPPPDPEDPPDTEEPPTDPPPVVPNTSPGHQIIVKDKAGVVLGEISHWFNLRFSDQENNYGQATFDVPIDSDDAVNLISLRRYEVDIIEDGVVIWSGEQANADVNVIADSPNLVTITCYTYLEMLNARYTDDYIRFDQVDQAEILKQLVEISQAKTDGNFSFTFATITPTKNRDREYKKDNIMEAYTNMANVIDGIDIWIDKDKVIHYGSPRRGVDKSNQFSFEWGVNIRELKISDNFSSPANTAYAIGSSDGVSQLISAFEDALARSTYKLRENTVSAIDISEVDTLQGKAEDLVNTNKNQRRTVRVAQMPKTTPRISQLSIGDSINVRFKKGRYDINTTFRVLGYECAIGEVGESNISWILADYQGV